MVASWEFRTVDYDIEFSLACQSARRSKRTSADARGRIQGERVNAERTRGRRSESKGAEGTGGRAETPHRDAQIKPIG